MSFVNFIEKHIENLFVYTIDKNLIKGRSFLWWDMGWGWYVPIGQYKYGMAP